MSARKPQKLVGWYRQISAFLQPMDISIHGAYTSFYITLAVFPILVILFAILNFTTLGPEDLLAFISAFVPDPFMPMAQKIVIGAYDHSSLVMVSVSAMVALWSASRGFLGLMRGLNAVYGVKEHRGYLRTRWICMMYTGVFLLLLLLTLVGYVFGTAILDFLQMATDPALQFIMSVLDLRFALLLALQVLVFTILYAYVPSRRSHPLRCLPGAVLASLGWIGYSKVFSLYVAYFPNYSNIYGSVYAVALAMVWLYFCVCIVFYGAALNRFLQEGLHKNLT